MQFKSMFVMVAIGLATVASPVRADDDNNKKRHEYNNKDRNDDHRRGDDSGHKSNGRDKNYYAKQKQYSQNYRAPYQQQAWQNYYRYDYRNPAPGQTRYYANQYYRSGNYYQARRLGAADRIYRGQDNRYYCRRSDGTTGLIVGGLAGGTLGSVIAPGGSQTLGALFGGALGAILGNSIGGSNVTCR